MKATYDKGPFRKVPHVVLSGLLVLSMCPTAGFAEQMKAASEEMVPDETPAMGMQGTEGGDLVLTAQDDGAGWTNWNNPNSLPDSMHPGDYRLTTDVTITDTWHAPAAGDISTTLDLNGHSITLVQSEEDPKPVVRVKKSDNECTASAIIAALCPNMPATNLKTSSPTLIRLPQMVTR